MTVTNTLIVIALVVVSLIVLIVAFGGKIEVAGQSLDFSDQIEAVENYNKPEVDLEISEEVSFSPRITPLLSPGKYITSGDFTLEITNNGYNSAEMVKFEWFVPRETADYADSTINPKTANEQFNIGAGVTKKVTLNIPSLKETDTEVSICVLHDKDKDLDNNCIKSFDIEGKIKIPEDSGSCSGGEKMCSDIGGCPTDEDICESNCINMQTTYNYVMGKRMTVKNCLEYECLGGPFSCGTFTDPQVCLKYGCEWK
jgi:hypothetical protein